MDLNRLEIIALNGHMLSRIVRDMDSRSVFYEHDLEWIVRYLTSGKNFVSYLL